MALMTAAAWVPTTDRSVQRNTCLLYTISRNGFCASTVHDQTLQLQLSSSKMYVVVCKNKLGNLYLGTAIYTSGICVREYRGRTTGIPRELSVSKFATNRPIKVEACLRLYL